LVEPAAVFKSPHQSPHLVMTINPIQDYPFSADYGQSFCLLKPIEEYFDQAK